MDDHNSVVVKRKRGRPPRSEPPKKLNKEEEDVCFICFDGGTLVLCDRRTCPKAYHPACIKRDDSFFQVDASWTCGWHICNVCLKAAHYMCYTCTYSLCKGCTSDADYLRVRGDKGFCATCMKTIMLIEKKEEGDNAMAHVDFDDKSSWEYLFKVYWLSLKEKLSLNFAELCQAKNPQKESHTMISKEQLPCFNVGTNNIQSATVDGTVVPQTSLYADAAIDRQNINLIYLRRDLMKNLLEDKMLHAKVVGSVVRIKIFGGEQKNDIYRLVKVVGTIKVPSPYKVGVKSTDVMLEVLNLDKKEVASIDAISNQDFSEDECRHLKQSIECGLVKRFTVGEIQETALALQSVKLNDCLEAGIRRLYHLHDQESKNGRKKELRECVESQEQQHKLCEIPDMHLDPNMDSGYKSEEAERLDSQKQVHCMKPKYSGPREGKPIFPRKECDVGHTGRRDCNFATPSERRNMSVTSSPNEDESAVAIQQRLSEGRDASRLRSFNNQAVGSSTTFSINASKISTPVFSVGNTSDAYSSESKLWHYMDPNGKIQGPFCMVHLKKWSTTGYFPPDMRIWAGDSQENSILLTDALKGLVHEVAYLPNDISSLSRDVGVTSDSELDMSDFGFTDKSGASRYSKQIDVHWHGDIARIQSSSKGQSLSSDGCNSWTSVRTTPVVSKCKTPLVSCSQEQDSSAVFVVRENEKRTSDDLNQDVRGCKYDPDYENRSSSALTVSKSCIEQIISDHSNNQGLSVQSSGDTWKNSPAEVSSCTLHLNSVPSLAFLNVAAQHGKLDVTDVRSPSQHRGETNGNKESVSCSAHFKDLGFQDHQKTGTGYLKKISDKTQQSMSLSSPYHDSAPNLRSTSSITVTVGELQPSEKTEDWDVYSPTSVKRCVKDWDFSLSSVSSIKPAEGLSDHVATATSTSDELDHYFETLSASYHSTCQLSSEPIEFTTLPEETISDLLEEVDAMEAQQVLASPTMTNSGGI